MGEQKNNYFIPLTKGSYADGPSPCIFSVPKMNYSKETQNFVNLLMKESRLTTRQKSGFESILRTGSSLPKRSEDMTRSRQYFSDRHAAKGRAMGLDVRREQCGHSRGVNPFRFMSMGTSCRRSLDVIRASGDLEHNSYPRKYTPFDKEIEKERFAHKMAFGENPHEAITHHQGQNEAVNNKSLKQNKSTKVAVVENRLHELVEDIKDRVDFLKCMEKIGNEKAYHAYIVCQIQQKLAEINSLSPTQVTKIIEDLQLAALDTCFIPGYKHTDSIFK